MRIRIALTLGAFLLVGGAITGTALADVAPSSTEPAPVVTPVPAPPSGIPTASAIPAPTAAQAPGRPSAVTPAPLPPTVAPSRGDAPAVPRAIPAGPTGDLHLPAITDGN